ncbi:MULTISPECIES: hypothetical protein [unclassified Mesorhizobium]|uniref:hypothetical protein n=1 Tax=unclassified Mesorhizobium TaxID=325217 RepID=UPI000FCAFF63|nr:MULTISPECIES: hypothetical protein [unclassified Mesorhizobium]RUV45212.1 hypothetical protein EOA85_36010 [Mesorhizobium sp. M5C.F.Ca.IN.020.29.1.1]RWB97350.1 MAG: hypothetical protein EOQ56_23565 [Mesorhizobium sp.]RWK44571.1 MAG: hypothetical protein EOR46_01295 [Mesorhizobium sp.]RWK53587.1 MAG: hypothetical protein EOR48_21735 [Mesorhizobium sp.]RWK68960.1 MAG: hypothetical protein EOR54_11280 [Mesorhizobium sp.]
MTDTVSRLLNACNAEKNKGADFPTIWKNILKGHLYVAGPPIQDSCDDGPILKIPLVTGQFLLFGSNFSLL